MYTSFQCLLENDVLHLDAVASEHWNLLNVDSPERLVMLKTHKHAYYQLPTPPRLVCNEANLFIRQIAVCIFQGALSETGDGNKKLC